MLILIKDLVLDKRHPVRMCVPEYEGSKRSENVHCRVDEETLTCKVFKG